ncbi:MAG: arginine--tRNA ligase [Candidatus Omnitrophota bacterium]
MKLVYKKISDALNEVLKKEYDISLEQPLWEVPAQQAFGDFSSMVALKLASCLKKDPLEIASSIKSFLEEKLSKDVDKIEILRPGFINIFISRKSLIGYLNAVIKNKEDFFRGKEGKKILIEFLSANPTGPLSIAHGRQAIVGDTIANILEFCGNQLNRDYYLNDAGRQIDLFAQSIINVSKALEDKKEDLSSVIPEGGYKGDYIKDIAADFLSKASGADAKIFGIESMIAKIKKDLKSLGVKKFDRWFSQDKLIKENKIEEVVDALKSKGLIYQKEAAIWFESTKFGDDKDRVIKKADGELTYFASDIAYHRQKCQEGYDMLINLWGPDHHGYIKRVESAIAALGNKKEILKIVIVQLVTLKTKERMSKRAGTAILLSDLISDIGKDAVRFYYITRKNSSHLEFDIDLAKKSSFDNPLYYIQYVCARIESIFRKAKATSFDSTFSRHLKLPEEISLLRTLLQFSYCLEKAEYSLEPVFIIEFLKNLASSFHKFYEKVRVIDDDQALTFARLNLLEAVRVVFHCGLGLLGITPAKKM